MPFQDTRNYKVTSEKAIKNFGFNPTHSVDDGIREMGDLFAEHRIKEVNNVRYSNLAFLKNVLKK